MSENSSELTTSPEDFAAVLDDWIAGATIATRSVEVYGNPGLFAEYEDLERQLVLAKGEVDLDETLGEDTGVESIYAKMGDLYARYMDSKSTWTIRALSDEDFAELREGLKWPDAPKEPDLSDKEKASMRQAAYDKLKAAFDAETKVLGHRLNLQILAKAVTNIRMADGRNVPGVTVPQLEALKKRLGERQLLKLIRTSQMVTYEEPKVPAPFSRRTSQNDQT